jgi:type I restriction enzyme R subunit
MLAAPSEFKAVRDPIIESLKKLGWIFIEPSKCAELRGNSTELFILRIFREKIKELNKIVIETDKQIDEVIKNLRTVRADVRGNQEFLQYLCGEKTIFMEKGIINFKLIDFKSIETNCFHITKELKFSQTRTETTDIVLLINGVPLLLVETKPPTVQDAMGEALAQIRRYHEEIPELMKIVQIFVLSDGTQLEFGPTWNLDRKNIHKWKTPQVSDLESLVKDFFAKNKILRLLGNYMFFFNKGEELQKFILDQSQMKAVERMAGKLCALQEKEDVEAS